MITLSPTNAVWPAPKITGLKSRWDACKLIARELGRVGINRFLAVPPTLIPQAHGARIAANMLLKETAPIRLHARLDTPLIEGGRHAE